jgi:hypothetical protein
MWNTTVVYRNVVFLAAVDKESYRSRIQFRVVPSSLALQEQGKSIGAGNVGVSDGK